MARRVVHWDDKVFEDLLSLDVTDEEVSDIIAIFREIANEPVPGTPVRFSLTDDLYIQVGRFLIAFRLDHSGRLLVLQAVLAPGFYGRLS